MLSTVITSFTIAGCASTSVDGPVHTVCGIEVGAAGQFAGGPTYVDMTGSRSTKTEYAYGVGEPGAGTAVRVSKSCDIGISVTLSPRTAGKATTEVAAKDGMPVVVLIALAASQKQVVVSFTNPKGKQIALTLLNQPSTMSSS
ncbi:MAG: hypothetical protein ABI775_01040 [Pseudonocardiales bacterium]